MTDSLFIYAAVFLSAVLAVDFLWRALVEPLLDRRVVNQRLARRERAARAEKLLKESEANAPRGSLLHGLQQLATGAGTTIRPQQIILGMAALSFLAVTAFWQATTLPRGMGLLLGAAIGCGLPFMYLSLKRSRRMKRLNDLLPDALDTMVRSLRAGHPVSVSLQAIAEQMPDPIGPEFGVVNDQIALGLDLPEALSRMAKRLGHQDLRFMVVAVGIQHQAGGNLAEVLSNLARVIRARAAMHRKKSAITAEGRMSFWVILSMPFAFVGLVNLISPQYFGEYWGHPILTVVFIICAILQFICGVVVWRMVNFKV